MRGLFCYLFHRKHWKLEETKQMRIHVRKKYICSKCSETQLIIVFDKEKFSELNEK